MKKLKQNFYLVTSLIILSIFFNSKINAQGPAMNSGIGDINVTGTYSISVDDVWDDAKKVRGIIEIHDDATLTITGAATIQFADSKADNIPTYIIVR